MKRKLLLTTMLTLFGLSIEAQILLEKIYPTGSNFADRLQIIKLTTSGYKYVTYDTTAIKIYNLNHSIWKTINIPYTGPYANYNGNIIYNISEELFNTNSADVEYMIRIYKANYVNNVYVYDEFGTILFSQDSVQPGGFNGNESNPIVYTTTGIKMLLSRANAQEKKAYVYSLPGILACNECANGVISGIVPTSGDNNMNNLSNPYPNPTYNTTTIPYNLAEGENTGQIVFFDLLGNEIKRFEVDRMFNQLHISAIDLAPGTYYYNLQTNKSNSQGKTLVVVK
ncbi:MAG: T9SS type A sorting domain-containing protein [Bacteroidota bacterium]